MSVDTNLYVRANLSLSGMADAIRRAIGLTMRPTDDDSYRVVDADECMFDVEANIFKDDPELESESSGYDFDVYIYMPWDRDARIAKALALFNGLKEMRVGSLLVVDEARGEVARFDAQE